MRYITKVGNRPLAVIALASFLSLSTVDAPNAAAQQTKQPVIVQPGAPGQPTRTLPPSTRPTLPPTSRADVQFMQHMIMHHAQAVEMTALIESHTDNKDVRSLGARISRSQSDEIKFMQRWLAARGEQLTAPMQHNTPGDNKSGHNMPGHNMPGHNTPGHNTSGHNPSGHNTPGNNTPGNNAPSPNTAGHDMPGTENHEMLMPGMLTAKQMDALKQAKGQEFDRLFLTGMIQHHNGALIMVKDLFNTAGSGQDAELFNFVTEVDTGQRAEIKIMQTMLGEKPEKD